MLMLSRISKEDLVFVSEGERRYFESQLKADRIHDDQIQVVSDVLVLMKRFFLTRGKLLGGVVGISFAISALVGDVFPVACYGRILESSLSSKTKNFLIAWVNDTFLEGLNRMRIKAMKESVVDSFLLDASNKLYE